ncbi:MAG TPA: type IV pilus modification protein PilV [Noviherbaspirillum sp.]
MERKAGGFSMVEVLVSIVVLAIGVLGAAGLQLSALRTASQSHLHSNALQLAIELADRMRANDDRMRLDDESNPFVGLDYQATSGLPAEPGTNCFSHACDAAALAAFDLYEWQKRIHAALPGGRAVICRDSAPWDEAKKRLSWDCLQTGSASASLVIKIGWQAREPDGALTKDVEGESLPVIALVVSPYVP